MTTPPSAGPDLAGRVALVTGGARGIGRAIAEALAGAGADVAVIDVRPAADTLAAVTALGRRGVALVGSVTERADVERAVADAVARLGRLDVVVNNAGVAARGGLEDLTDELLDRDLGVILKGTILMTGAAYPHLKASRGAVVNIASVSGMAGGAVSREVDGAAGVGRTGPAYAAAKGGVIAFTRWLAKDAGRWGVRVNAVSPGPIDTEMTRGFDYDVASQPLARMGVPEDIAQAVLYLASPMSNFVTGQVLVVDGGLVMD
jgi:3-oxoacyl-[acyl-carrier protein] reductase